MHAARVSQVELKMVRGNQFWRQVVFLSQTPKLLTQQVIVHYFTDRTGPNSQTILRNGPDELDIT